MGKERWRNKEEFAVLKSRSYESIMAAHDRCVEIAQLYASNMQGDDTKRKLWRSLQEKETTYRRKLKRALEK